MIAICDDERVQLDILEGMLLASPAIKKEYGEGNPPEIMRFGTGEDLLEAVKKRKLRFDFIFLDIEMPGMGGLETYKALIGLTAAPVVFVSTHSERLPDIFATLPAGYLAKPYEQTTLDRTVTVAVSRKSEQHLYRCTVNGRPVAIPYDDIRYFAIYNHDLFAFTDREVPLARASLDDVEREMSPFGFFRCQRSYVINFRYYKDRDAKNVYLAGPAKGGDIDIPLGKERVAKLDGSFLSYKLTRDL